MSGDITLRNHIHATLQQSTSNTSSTGALPKRGLSLAERRADFKTHKNARKGNTQAKLDVKEPRVIEVEDDESQSDGQDGYFETTTDQQVSVETIKLTNFHRIQQQEGSGSSAKKLGMQIRTEE